MECTPITTSSMPLIGSTATEEPGAPSTAQTAVLEFFFPGMSVLSGFVQKYLHVDLTLYLPLVVLFGGITWAWRYLTEYSWTQIESHLMSTLDVRPDDEVYNILMSWVARQKFAQRARRFLVQTNVGSRSSYSWRWSWDDDEDDDDDPPSDPETKTPLSYTPTFGSHYFWYCGRLLVFQRSEKSGGSPYRSSSDSEHISISCLGRDPWVLKRLVNEARAEYVKRDESKTIIYRGTSRYYGADTSWQRCMARTPRPLSTVILNEQVKKELVADVTEYLNPVTRRWYSNRGIPYRRGYLLYGPPGTGKSSLSLALAGLFKMRIYIVSLNSAVMSEEVLSNLFAELPRRCVVLLEDIDTAGLTHTRESDGTSGPGNNTTAGRADAAAAAPKDSDDQSTGSPDMGHGPPGGRLSLSGLLNILDGVASQEGRLLLMTTNHIEKLDKALIRPGRVDMIVKFDLADEKMAADVFRAIFEPLQADEVSQKPPPLSDSPHAVQEKSNTVKDVALASRGAAEVIRLEELAREFGCKVPAHEFSPAEIQGYLLKRKHDPEAAVAAVDEWVRQSRKDKIDKPLEDAEKKRKEAEKQTEGKNDGEKGKADAGKKESEGKKMEKGVEVEVRLGRTKKKLGKLKKKVAKMEAFERKMRNKMKKKKKQQKKLEKKRKESDGTRDGYDSSSSDSSLSSSSSSDSKSDSGSETESVSAKTSKGKKMKGKLRGEGAADGTQVQEHQPPEKAEEGPQESNKPPEEQSATVEREGSPTAASMPTGHTPCSPGKATVVSADSLLASDSGYGTPMSAEFDKATLG